MDNLPSQLEIDVAIVGNSNGIVLFGQKDVVLMGYNFRLLCKNERK